MKKIFKIPVTICLLILPAAAQEPVEIVTDRPDKTESAVTVPKGFIQFEAGGTAEYDDIIYGSRNQYSESRSVFTLTSPSALIRYGLLNGLELRLAADFIDETITMTPRITDTALILLTPGSRTTVKYGWSMIGLGAKFKFLNEKKWIPNGALLVNFRIPYGDYSFQADYISPEFTLAFQHPLSEKFSFSYNLGYGWYIYDKFSDRYGKYSASLGVQVLKKLGVFIESYGSFTEGSSPDHRLDGGLTYLVTKNVQADFSGGIGVTDKSPDHFIGFGISIRLPE